VFPPEARCRLWGSASKGGSSTIGKITVTGGVGG
jgi:hypothetical protein